MTDFDLGREFDLERFVEAQDSLYDQVLSELSTGRKRSHWMWFIFPQIHGLGSSPMALQFAISGLKEAVAYLDHPVLGPRLDECTRLVNEIQGREISQILGYPDDLKFRSSITLFAQAAAHAGTDESVYAEALRLYFDGSPDAATLERL